MLTVIQPAYGTPAVLRLLDTPRPVPQADEVLIRVHAACLNSWDWDRLTGRPTAWRLFSGILRPKQRVPGCDLAGVVAAVGPKVQRLRVGDAVMGDLSAKGAWGALAEYAVASETILALKAPELSFEQAACLPQAGILALQAFHEALSPQPGQRLLISGAGGGVGTLAIQMAKVRGVRVTVCDRREKLDALLDLGADEALAWPDPGCYGTGRTWDRILDVNISLPMDAYLRALAPGGVHAIVGGTPGSLLHYLVAGRRMAKKQGKTFKVVAQKTTVPDLETLMQMAVSGEAKPVIDSSFALADAVKAFEQYGEGRFVGKIVIQCRT